MRGYRIAIIGATGIIGQAFISCLQRRQFPVLRLSLFASSRSEDREIVFKGERLKVHRLCPEGLKGHDLVFFTAGSEVSREFVPLAQRTGAMVIDNSSAFRMHHDVPLVVPEVNPQDITKHKGLIANPNCAAIQLVMVLKPIHDLTPIERVIVSTYQAVSGAGGRALQEAKNQSEIALHEDPIHSQIFPAQIAFNLIPQIPQRDAFLPDGYTLEEEKIEQETRKIMGSSIRLSATCVRVPVWNCHSESVNIETRVRLTPQDVVRVLSGAPGVRVCPDPEAYPTPVQVSGSEEVFVGRIRQDRSHPRGINLWIVADNLLKGAALNAIQIAERIIYG